jgi:hypothetical protein
MACVIRRISGNTTQAMNGMLTHSPGPVESARPPGDMLTYREVRLPSGEALAEPLFPLLSQAPKNGIARRDFEFWFLA